MELKNVFTLPFHIVLHSLNYLQSRFSRQPQPAMHDDIKLNHEFKEELMSFEDLVMTKNYPLEIHYVETEDGYRLKLYRIPAGKNEANYKFKQKQAIFIMHGIFDSSDGLICNDEEKCIPFILANLGYDIWLGNNRGNKHSRYHKTYTTDMKEFWDFSFHEMGMYDLPAFLDHIVKINKFSAKVIYMGHSQGTAQLFAALTQKQDYFKSRIKLFIALGPVSRVYFLKSRLLKLMNKLRVDYLFNKLQFHEVLNSDEKLLKASSWLLPKVPLVCNLISDLLSDHYSSSNNNQKRMSVYISHGPGGSSLKAVTHFVQLYRSKCFRMYDYGPKINLEKYGSFEPKEYNLKEINNFPTALFSGRLDKLSTPIDVQWLREQLGDNVIFERVYENMGHMTFLMAQDMTWFNEVIDLIDLYN
jgi:pimeloyl-ACP methyl ester carboxylesterase